MANRRGRTRIVGALSNGISSGWFGYGEDGDLTVAANQTVTLPVTEDTGQIYKRYQNLTIESGAVLKPSARSDGTLILPKGDLLVHGPISADQCAPLLNDAEDVPKTQQHIALAGAMTGGNGGRGESSGGIGGNGFWCGGGYGGGGGSRGGDSEPRPPKGITWPWPATMSGTAKQQYGAGTSVSSARGGNAPGGSAPGNIYEHNERDGVYINRYDPGQAGDAYGGGAIWLFVQGNVIISKTGKITANGGVGANGTRWSSYSIYEKDDGSGYETAGSFSGYSECGGSGGGGIVFITYGGTFTNEGSIEANGGQTPANRASSDSNTSGSVGTVRIVPFIELV